MLSKKSAGVAGLILLFLMTLGYIEAQSQPPDPEVKIDSPETAAKGVPFYLNISAVNKGGKTGSGSTITVSTPDSNVLSRKLLSHNIGDATSCPNYCMVATTEEDVRTYNIGDTVWTKNGESKSTEDLMIEGSPETWDPGEENYMDLVFVPEETGKVRFYIRTTLNDESGNKYTSPENSEFYDQQGYRVRKITVDVQKRYNLLESAKAGFYYGDICYERPYKVEKLDCSQITEEHPIGYTTGQIGSGIAIFGDLRDFTENSRSGNEVMTFLSLVAVAPAAGDFVSGAGKSSRVLSKFSDRFPSRTDDLSSIVSKLEDLDKPAKIRSLDDLYNGAASNLRSQSMSDDKIIELGRLSDGSFDLKNVREFIDEGGESAKKTVRQLKPEETKRLLRLPESVSRQLPANIDDSRHIKKLDHSTEVLGTRHSVLVESQYIDDTSEFLDDVEELENVRNVEDLSKGQLGEAIAEKRVKDIIKDTGEEPEAVIRKGYDGNVNSKGTDIIYKDPNSQELVVEEVKFSSKSGNIGVEILGDTSSGKQLSESYLSDIADESRGLKREDSLELRDAIRKENVRKELAIIQNRVQDGKTIRKSINSGAVKMDKVNLIKTGGVR